MWRGGSSAGRRMTPQSRSGRILAIDPGEKRIGVAAADLRTRVAIPLRTIAIGAGADPVEAVARLAEEEGAEAIVIGLALSLSGALGPQAQRAQSLADALARRLAIRVHTWDERLTSAEALRRSSAQAQRRLPRDKRSPRAKRPRGDLDAAAAAIILQAFLDSQRRPASG
jgi:putative Holliday junction resolvase